MTQPTPPPTPALPPPDALARVAAAPHSSCPGGGRSRASRPRSGAPGRRPRSGRWSFSPPRSATRIPARRTAAAVTRFFTWCDARGLELAQISPIAVATYIDEMQRPVSRPHDQAASGRHPPPLRLAGDRAGGANQPGRLGARADPRRQDGQDAGPAARRSAAAAGRYRHRRPSPACAIARCWE